MEEEKRNELLKKREFNLHNARLFVQPAAIFLIVVVAAVFFVEFWLSVRNGGALRKVLSEHIKAALGIPLAGISAFVLVIVFEKFSGDVELKALGIEFKGAAGPIIMWLVSFWGLVAGLEFLW